MGGYIKILVMLVLFMISGEAYSADVMKFTYYDSYAPRSYLENGEMRGILIDIVNEAVKNRMGIEVEHKGYPWQRAQLLVKQGEADAYVTVPTQVRREYTEISTEPLFKFETYTATMKNSPLADEIANIDNIEDLKPYKIVDYHGNGWAKKILSGHNVFWLPDYGSIFRFLEQGKADLVIVSRKSAHTIKELGFEDKIVTHKKPLTSVAFHLCVGKGSKFREILPEFDKTIKQMQNDGVIDKILNRYYR